jgi:hypothetical protein
MCVRRARRRRPTPPGCGAAGTRHTRLCHPGVARGATPARSPTHSCGSVRGAAETSQPRGVAQERAADVSQSCRSPRRPASAPIDWRPPRRAARIFHDLPRPLPRARLGVPHVVDPPPPHHHHHHAPSLRACVACAVSIDPIFPTEPTASILFRDDFTGTSLNSAEWFFDAGRCDTYSWYQCMSSTPTLSVSNGNVTIISPGGR